MYRQYSLQNPAGALTESDDTTIYLPFYIRFPLDLKIASSNSLDKTDIIFAFFNLYVLVGSAGGDKTARTIGKINGTRLVVDREPGKPYNIFSHYSRRC